MIKNLILDWSGTIANDAEFTLLATNETLKHFGAKAISQREYLENFKIPVDGFYKKYLPHTNIDLIDDFFFKWYKANSAQVVFYEKINFLLNFAEEFSINLYICSTLATDVLENITKTKGIYKKFNKIYGNSFNKITALKKIVIENKMLGDETIMIGDTLHDIEAAKMANIRAGAVTYGYTPKDIIRKSQADEIFESPADLIFKIAADYAPAYFQKPIITVGGIIFDDQNNALLIRTDKWSGKWGIPGGKIKYNESMIDAFTREIKEETNLDIENIELVLIQDCIQHPEFYLPRHFVLINYIAKAKHKNVIINYESIEYKWISLIDALKLNLNEPTRTLIQKVLK